MSVIEMRERLTVTHGDWRDQECQSTITVTQRMTTTILLPTYRSEFATFLSTPGLFYILTKEIKVRQLLQMLHALRIRFHDPFHHSNNKTHSP